MKVTVYCGAHFGRSGRYREVARRVGDWIGRSGHSLVYGGGSVGLMGVVADAVLACGGYVLGVIPRFFVDRELAHHGIQELIEVEDMSERKNRMISEGDAFIALPGGMGTLEEIVEVISWCKIGLLNKACVFYNEGGYYSLLGEMFDKMVEEGFLHREDRERILFSCDLQEIQEFIEGREIKKEVV